MSFSFITSLAIGFFGKVRIVVNIKKVKESLGNTTKCWHKLSHRYNKDYRNMLEERIYSQGEFLHVIDRDTLLTLLV